MLQLSYHPDGRPFKAAKPSSLSDEKRTTSGWHEALSLVSPSTVDIRAATQASTLAMARLDEISATAPSWEKLARTEEVLSHIVPLMGQVEQLRRSLDVDGVRVYAEKLREEVKQGPASIMEGSGSESETRGK